MLTPQSYPGPAAGHPAASPVREEKPVFDPAAAAADEPLRPGQYRSVGTRAWWLASGGPARNRYCFLAEIVTQLWVPAEAPLEWLLDRRVTGRRIWLLSSAEQVREAGLEIPGGWPAGRWQAPYGDFAAAREGRAPEPREGCWQVPTAEFLAALPRDPARLLQRLQADSPATRPGYHGPFTYAADVLRSGLVPADLRAALYQALLSLPAVRLDGAAGRDGSGEAALILDDGARRHEVFISPAGAQFTGERTTLTKDTADLPAGTVTASAAVTVAAAGQPGQVPMRVAATPPPPSPGGQTGITR